MNMYSFIHENLKVGSSAQTSVKRPVNVDHTIFSLILTVIFLICAEANIVPLNLKRN